jgi:hypothetical protein
MKKEEIFKQLFLFSAPTFYNWQREKRPIIQFLEKYFTKEDLEEFLQTGKIQKLEEIENILEYKEMVVEKNAKMLNSVLEDDRCSYILNDENEFDDDDTLDLLAQIRAVQHETRTIMEKFLIHIIFLLRKNKNKNFKIIVMAAARSTAQPVPNAEILSMELYRVFMDHYEQLPLNAQKFFLLNLEEILNYLKNNFQSGKNLKEKLDEFEK